MLIFVLITLMNETRFTSFLEKVYRVKKIGHSVFLYRFLSYCFLCSIINMIFSHSFLFSLVFNFLSIFSFDSFIMHEKLYSEKFLFQRIRECSQGSRLLSKTVIYPYLELFIFSMQILSPLPLKSRLNNMVHEHKPHYFMILPLLTPRENFISNIANYLTLKRFEHFFLS